MDARRRFLRYLTQAASLHSATIRVHGTRRRPSLCRVTSPTCCSAWTSVCTCLSSRPSACARVRMVCGVLWASVVAGLPRTHNGRCRTRGVQRRRGVRTAGHPASGDGARRAWRYGPRAGRDRPVVVAHHTRHTGTSGAQAAADFFLALPPLQGYAVPGREQARRALPLASRRSSAERRRRRWRTAPGQIGRAHV